MRITTPYGTLLVNEDTRISLAYTNPLVANEGSHSLPFSVPWCDHNLAALGHPENPHRATDQPNFITASVELQGYNETGTLSLVDLVKGDRIELSFLTREGSFWNYAKGVNLRETIALKSSISWYSARAGYFSGSYPDKLFAIFPLVLGFSGSTEENFYIVNNVYPLIDDQASYDVYTNKPALGGYLYVPFVLSLIFRKIGYRITDSVFLTDTELKSAVVLNNYIFEWDNPLYPGELMYDIQKMLPNCTVAEFMEALEMEFGVMFDIDYHNGTVSIKQIKERINSTAFTKLNGDITRVMQLKKGFELTNDTTDSPYSLMDEDFLKNFDIDSIEVVNGGIIEGRAIASGVTPDRTTYPEKVIFCKGNQTYFRLEWHQKESAWEYIATPIHSNFSNWHNHNFNDKIQRSSKAHSAPMVPNRIGIGHGWRPMGFPFYGKDYNPNYLFDANSLNMENFIVSDNDTAPISFAFYRGVIRFTLDEGVWGEPYWDLPYGSTDLYLQEDGSAYSNINYALRHNGTKGIVANWYQEYKALMEDIGTRFSLIYCNQYKDILKNLTGKFLCQGIPFIIERMEITLSNAGVEVDSVDCLSTKHPLED